MPSTSPSQPHEPIPGRSGRARATRRIVVGLLLAALSSAGVVAVGAATDTNTNARAVVLFVGDSNVVQSSESINSVLTLGPRMNNSYVPVLAARPGAAIRTPDCGEPTTCTTFDYWKLRLANVLPKVEADAIVSDLGINDSLSKGTETTRGYAFYGRKIDWFMNLVGGKPVVWTTLPCALEPSAFRTGCKTVNYELNRAVQRWPNLILVRWGTAARSHPEYMRSVTDVHYTDLGRIAWTKLVVAALDAHFPSA